MVAKECRPTYKISIATVVSAIRSHYSHMYQDLVVSRGLVLHRPTKGCRKAAHCTRRGSFVWAWLSFVWIDREKVKAGERSMALVLASLTIEILKKHCTYCSLGLIVAVHILTDLDYY